MSLVEQVKASCNSLRLLLTDQLTVAAPTGVAAFIIHSKTLHTLLSLPTRGDFKDLEENRLHQLQHKLSTVKYIIIVEMSMVGRKILGHIDRRLHQVFPHHAQEVFGGCSVVLFGDFGQLPSSLASQSYFSACAHAHGNK